MIDYKREWKPLLIIVAIFLACFYLPAGNARFDNAVLEAFHLVKWYAREHVLLCLIPAFYIAGAITLFIRQEAVMKHLGAGANKILAYSVASVSGTILSVCSCTVLPLFAGIYKMGAGLGPASAFLYSGPAINVLAIILTARILGTDIGAARAIFAILLSIIIGLTMHLLFRKEEASKKQMTILNNSPETERTLLQNMLFFGLMVFILVFANWGKPVSESGLWFTIWSLKWFITTISSLLLGITLVVWFKWKLWKFLICMAGGAASYFISGGHYLITWTTSIVIFSALTCIDKGETGEWFSASWDFGKMITPLLLIGILVAGFCLGRPGKEGIIPSEWVIKFVGGNSFTSNFAASFIGAFMYFATLTEVPILQGLMGSGMGKGPALALLLSGPALSLPSILVLRGIIGNKKTIAFTICVIVFSSIAGWIFGNISK